MSKVAFHHAGVPRWVNDPRRKREPLRAPFPQARRPQWWSKAAAKAYTRALDGKDPTPEEVLFFGTPTHAEIIRRMGVVERLLAQIYRPDEIERLAFADSVIWGSLRKSTDFYGDRKP